MMSKGKIDLIKNVIKENVEAESDKDIPTVDTDDENLKSESGIVIKNAYEIMLKSVQGGQKSPLWPVKSRRKKIIGLTPRKSGQKSIRDWMMDGNAK